MSKTTRTGASFFIRAFCLTAVGAGVVIAGCSSAAKGDEEASIVGVTDEAFTGPTGEGALCSPSLTWKVRHEGFSNCDAYNQANKPCPAFNRFEELMDHSNCLAGGVPPEASNNFKGSRSVVEYNPPDWHPGIKQREDGGLGDQWLYALCPYDQLVLNEVRAYSTSTEAPVYAHKLYCEGGKSLYGDDRGNWDSDADLPQAIIVFYDPLCQTCGVHPGQ